MIVSPPYELPDSMKPRGPPRRRLMTEDRPPARYLPVLANHTNCPTATGRQRLPEGTNNTFTSMKHSTNLTDIEIRGFFGPTIDRRSSEAREARRRIRVTLKKGGGKVNRIVVFQGKTIVTTDAPRSLSLLSHLFSKVQNITITELDPMVAIQLKSEMKAAAESTASDS
jgi:hypothetical protein